jgi:hypothetical protein
VIDDDAVVGRSYTKGRKQPYLIRKWPGSRWALPLGPYTLTQLVLCVASIYLMVTYSNWWAHFGGFNIIIGAGVPIVLVFAARHTRIEGRDPLRAAMAALTYLAQPRGGYLAGQGYRPPAAYTQPGRRFAVIDLPTRPDVPSHAAQTTPAAALRLSPALQTLARNRRTAT